MPRAGLDEVQDAAGPTSSLSESLWHLGCSCSLGSVEETGQGLDCGQCGLPQPTLQMGGGNSGHLQSQDSRDRECRIKMSAWPAASPAGGGLCSRPLSWATDSCLCVHMAFSPGAGWMTLF